VYHYCLAPHYSIPNKSFNYRGFYNSSSTISDTFDSVLNQTYIDIKHIVIDRNSQDGTISVIKEYEPQFTGRVHWISKPDQGPYEAMNKGIKMATGDFIGILNSDDCFIDNHVVEDIIKEIEIYDTDAIYGNLLFVDRNNSSNPIAHLAEIGFY
jgi:glycosyltransferase involved in cell wall biosynthesis